MNILISSDQVSDSIHQTLESTSPSRDALHVYGRSYRGLFQSNKGLDGQSIQFESALARDALRLFELAPEVITIISEPSVIEFILEEELRRYRPDYLLHLHDGRRALVEIKYGKEAHTPTNQARYKEVGNLVEQAGGMFAVLTEEHLRTRVLQQNIPLLERHRHLEVTRSANAWLQKKLAASGHLSLEAAANQLGRPTVLAAIAQGLVLVDFRNRLITNASILRRI